MEIVSSYISLRSHRHLVHINRYKDPRYAFELSDYRKKMTQFGTPTRSQAGTSSFPPSRPTSPPTLSRRSTGTPSIDPPRSQGRNDEQRRARRAQLRDFYGIDNAGPSSSQANGGSGDDGAVNVDSEGFDAVKYYEDMIGKSSLEELMKRAVALTAGELINLLNEYITQRKGYMLKFTRSWRSTIIPPFLGV